MPCLSGYEASPPLLGSPPPPPPPRPSPPPPPLKMVREWEGVGVWPVATAPPWDSAHNGTLKLQQFKYV